HAGAGRGAGRDSARHPHRGHRHAVLHLAPGRHAAALVVTLAGRGLSIGYRDRVVGRSLDVSLQQGEVLALLGPNGSGKTTLLKTLLGILAPLGGAALIEERPIAAYSARE